MNIIKRIICKFRKKMEESNYTPKRDKVMSQRFSNKELLDLFPRYNRIDLKDVQEAINNVFSQLKSYREIWNFIMMSVEQSFPPPTSEQYINESAYCDEYRDYFSGGEFSKFVKCVTSEFLNRRGLKRTFEEACHIATDKWMEMLFGLHIQDNGDRSNSGFMTTMLASIAKNKASEKYSHEIVEKTHELIYNYYRNGSLYKGSYGCHKMGLYCDYGPNGPLYDILINAGIDKNDARIIAPWKTGIEVDENDNSVVVRGYQREDLV